MTIFALVDCNNFFVSCERVFNPRLENKPVIVLSNNDGCIVARSNEVKALGIPMGAPFYMYKDVCERHKVKVFSSNFQLYGDMSNRVMEVLRQMVTEMEVYSIDEAFLKLDGYSEEAIEEYAQVIRAKIKMWTGLPVSIGIGPTKTLAKIANAVAKKALAGGVFSILHKETQDEILSRLDIEEIWGISTRWGAQFRRFGMYKAIHIRDADYKMIRKNFSVVGERIVAELRGVPCFPIGKRIDTRKNITASRSFGKRVVSKEDLKEAIAYYTARASIKLRKQQSRAQGIYVYVRSNKYSKATTEYYSQGKSLGFIMPLSDTRKLIKAAHACLDDIYKPGITYHKAGVILMDLVPENQAQSDLFFDIDNLHSDKLMHSLDMINSYLGETSVFLAAQGLKRDWQMRSDKRSGRFTTSWKELPQALCK